MKSFCLAAALLAFSAAIGFRYQDSPYRTIHAGMHADARVLSHRGSPYSQLSWIASQGANELNLYFFDVSHGGICLEPSWDTYASLGPSLAHLANPSVLDAGSVLHSAPNPGTLVSTPYLYLFPIGVLLNSQRMNRFKQDVRLADPNILIIGLGAGAGVSILAHHFPQASITVVDIDAAVIEGVREHYPFLRWLETQRTQDSRARLRLLAMDGRQYIRRIARENSKPYDLIILDAYTLGLTVPPHLMTREFYQETMACLREGGIVLSNVAGSFSGKKQRMLSGAVRSMKAAGLSHVQILPVYRLGEHRDHQDTRILRNMMVLASRSALTLSDNPEGWSRVAAFVPYPEFVLQRWVSRSFYLANDERVLTAKIPLERSSGVPDAAFLEMLERRTRQAKSRVEGLGARWVLVEEKDLLKDAAQAVQDYGMRGHEPFGWRNPPSDARLIYEEIDWVRLAREVYADAVRAAMSPARGESAADAIFDASQGPLFTDAQPNADLVY